jgi:hypothetical protein
MTHNKKGHKGTKAKIIGSTISYDMCCLCGYTCQQFKDKKLQEKIVKLHMIKKHGITEFWDKTYDDHPNVLSCPNNTLNELLFSQCKKDREDFLSRNNPDNLD